MSGIWLPWCDRYDLTGTVNYGPFRQQLGVVLHVNVDAAGTPRSYWAKPPNYVCPNLQVYPDGRTDQLLPLDWQPWCQEAGNQAYAAVETAGTPDVPLTPAQIDSCARIMAAYHEHCGVPLAIADTVGARGLGTHKMGGAAWGGHDCPGAIRSAQRQAILDQAGAAMTISISDANTIVDVMIQRLFLGADTKPHQTLTLVREALQAECADGGAVSMLATGLTGKVIHGDADHPNAQDDIGPLVRQIAAKLGITATPSAGA